MRKLLFMFLIGASACAARSTQLAVPTVYAAGDPRTGDDAIVARYLQGETLDELANDLRLGDRDEARSVVRRAMQSLRRRYYTER
jgi:hypothetical protein